MSIRGIYTAAEYHQMIASLMKEKEWQQKVIDLATTLGYQCYHTWNSKHSQSGYPDLHLIRPPRSLFVELKKERGKPTKEQQHWLDMLKDCGYEAYVWRPSNWDEVIEILQRKSA